MNLVHCHKVATALGVHPSVVIAIRTVGKAVVELCTFLEGTNRPMTCKSLRAISDAYANAEPETADFRIKMGADWLLMNLPKDA